jgi:hypothetical protein
MEAGAFGPIVEKCEVLFAKIVDMKCISSKV